MTSLPKPHLDNVRGLRNRISSAAEPALLDEADAALPYVDTNYGHSWTFTPKRGAAVYGKTQNFPKSCLDDLARGRFLRVPFRRVPVIDVSTPQELANLVASIEGAMDGDQLRWRGQPRDYPIPRVEDEAMRLYGDATVFEPSLFPSAARAKLDFKEVFLSWSAILDLYLTEMADALIGNVDAAWKRNELFNFRNSYNYRLWAFATAQHYGLPSVGLDVTTDIWVAALFALHRFGRTDASARMTVCRLGAEESPVIYAMAGFEHDLFDDQEIAPAWLQCARPKAQAAHFFGTGWGLAPNRAAERILAAVRLQQHWEWALPKSVAELFPSPAEDLLLTFLLETQDRFPEFAKQARLDQVYYVG
jgi:hypothetical protein